MFDNELYNRVSEYREAPGYSSIFGFNLRLEMFDIGKMIRKTKISTASVLLLLGCGCSNYDNGYYGKEYEPHLARLLYNMGTKVLGVDIGDNSNEIFPHEKIDLLEQSEKLSTLVGDFDIVFDGRLSETQNMCPILKARLRSSSTTELFQERLRQEVGNILKPKGVYIVSGVSIGYDYIWQKLDGEMKLRGYTTDSGKVIHKIGKP